MNLILWLSLISAACVGAFLLPLTIVNRLSSRMPDSKLKALLEGILYLLSFLFPIYLCWVASARKEVLNLTFFTEPVHLAGLIPFWITFILYTGTDITRHIRGKPFIPQVSTHFSICPYSMQSEDPAIFFPALNRIYHLEKTVLQVKIEGLDPGIKGLRLGHLTDFHLGKHCHRNYLKHAVDLMMTEKPDLIGITGDFVNFRKYMDDCFEDLADLEAPLGIYAVRGNHDYWIGAERIEKRIVALGMTLLDDKTIEIKRNGSSFMLSGTEQRWKKKPPPSDHFPRNSNLLKIVLAHTPDDFPYLIEHEPHLVICGHTHGGQVCFPFFGPVVVPSDYGRRYASGLFMERKSLLYVSRGIGCYPPFRMLCNPEITIIEFV